MDANESVQATDDSGDPGLIEEGSVGEVDHPTDSSDVIARDELTEDTHSATANVLSISDQKNINTSEVNSGEGEVVKLLDNEITKLTISTSVPDEVVQESSKKAENKGSEKLSKSEADLKHLCQNMFTKLEKFLEGEVGSSVNDYALLESMNKATTMKYQSVLKDAKTVVQGMHEVNTKFSHLRVYLEQIEQIEQEVVTLEQAAYKLDGYAKRLEEKFRKLEKR